MTQPITLILTFVFSILGLLHFYWACGGDFGFEASIPSKENGEKLIQPKKLDSVIVGLVLISFALFYFSYYLEINHKIPKWIQKYGSGIIPAIFILRAIGDFRYIGFFKKTNQTLFGKNDTKYFSPLCLIIGVLGIIFFLLSS